MLNGILYIVYMYICCFINIYYMVDFKEMH